jgi:hypothetical protein
VFDKDGQATIALYAVTSHGRATPLVWKTIDKSKLKERRGEYELEVVSRLHEILPADVDVMQLAERGSATRSSSPGSTPLAGASSFAFVRTSPLLATARASRQATARRTDHAWEDASRGGGSVASEGHEGGVVPRDEPRGAGGGDGDRAVLAGVHDRETFRDIKDNHFGMGLSATHIGTPERRDRLLFISAVAQALLTLLGAAGEPCGLDRTLKANTVKHRTMSLFNQGSYWYRRIPNMGDERLRPLMTSFGELLSRQPAFTQRCGIL